jgi:protein tyrosine/serine phosphatase
MKSLFKAITLASLIISLPAAAWPTWNDAKEQLKKVAYYITPASSNPHNLFNDNYHQIAEGVYRSKTMSPASLQKHINQDGIKKILILREDGMNNYWRTAQTAVAQANNVEMVTHVLNARVLPSQEKLQAVYNVLKDCKDNNKNLLIHCVAGVDRTGQIAALRLLMEQNTTLEDALKQLTGKYGHHEWRFPHCREAIKQLYALREQHGSIETAISNLQWNEFKPASLSKRAYVAFKETIKEAVKNNPKTAIALGAVAAIGAAATIAHAKGKLVPAYQSMKETLFGKKQA